MTRIFATDFWRQQDPTLSTSIPPPASTFTRAGTAYRHYPYGDETRLEEIGSDVLRCSWQRDVDTGLWIRGAHLEPGRTNLCTNNTNIVSTWTKDGVTPADMTALLPDGTDSVDDVLHEDTSSGFHRCYSAVGALNPAITYSCSVFIYPINRFGLQIYCNNKVFKIDCQALTVTGGDVIDSQVIDLGSGWFYCWASWTGLVGSYFGVYAMKDGDPVYAGEDIDALALWGVQLEEGEYPSSLIVTAGSASRTADSDYQVAAPLPAAKQGWLATKIYITPHTNSSEISLLTLSDGGSAADRIRLVINTSQNLELQSTCSGGDGGFVEAGSVMDGRTEGHDLYLTWRPGELCLALDGVFGTSDHVVSIPDNLDQLNIHPSGAIIGNVQMGDKFSRVPWGFLASI